MNDAKAQQRILVMGCGAIGGTIATHLTEVGADVIGVTTNQAIAEAVQSRGFVVERDGERRTIEGRMELGIPDGARFDLVLLATQPPQVVEAARSALPHLEDNGTMVVLQNGLCEAHVGEVVGHERVIGAIVSWSASMPEPGVYEQTTSGGFTIGRMQEAPDDKVRQLASLLEVIGPVTITTNLTGARFSKLALNCTVSALGTLGGDRMGPLVRIRAVRRLGLDIFTEAVKIARHENIKLEKVAGTVDLDWVALTDAEQRTRGSAGLAAKHALLLAIGLRYRRMRSSMLAAIERGRKPAIDFLNGEIVARGQQFGISVPVNELVVDRIHALARGDIKPSRELLQQVYDQTRTT